jgi:hypothetical protein
MDPLEILPYPHSVTTASPMFLASLFVTYMLYIVVMLNCLRQQRGGIVQTSVRH